ncbi:hypothetical protein Tph_c02160 [Thermacetogenium phaeum DSM 12270]|uniref:Uncharacterized protein n=1 Tax=Thermacetogenium phaeum (strain ATCC BAA-254 / DSM 26808 / PB) TaxID=1089553 RepID=K4LCJ3_THEPS|nr:hypothetical protein [Thermacetogenium phaeum]AFV10463.1 hypothetical protein Tph_c02160 [Thermacetogenium phaeum DSM 12270]
MLSALEKVSQDFLALTLQEKLEFLKRITNTPPGEWVEMDGKLHFIPEGPPATEEEEEVFQRENEEIDAGRGITLHELKKKFEV